jgi:type I restriction enzyme M protein
MATEITEIERRLWAVADQLRANSGLKPSEYSRPVLGLLFLRYAESRFAAVEAELQPRPGSRMGPPGPDAFKARGVIYLAPGARFSYLLTLPDSADLGKALNEAMKAIEDANPDLEDALPKNYGAVPDEILRELIKLLAPLDIAGDAFGQVYEYFMGSFAMQEMQKGGEFYTPSSIVDLIVQIIEPYHGRILDPACGSGGMFVHSAKFVRSHQKDPGRELSIWGLEKVVETQRFARMNLAVHGLGGNIRVANAYYEEPFEIVGQFDYVMANPPFNVDGVDKEKDAVKKRPDRFPFGLPTVNNGNYLWISLFYAALKPTGRSGFVMANSASDAGGSEREMRRKLIQTGAVDCIVAVGPNMFFTVTLPVTLWFFDKGKAGGLRGDQVLFVDARHLFRQVTRAHRVFDPDHVEFLANIVRLWRGETAESSAGSGGRMSEMFPTSHYRNVPGLCYAASLEEIASQDWSLNPGRYVGVAPGQTQDDEDFHMRLGALQEELDKLNIEATQLQAKVAQNVAEMLEV